MLGMPARRDPHPRTVRPGLTYGILRLRSWALSLVPNHLPRPREILCDWPVFVRENVRCPPALLPASLLHKGGALSQDALRGSLPLLPLGATLLSLNCSAFACLAAMARGPSWFSVGCGSAFHAHWLRG